MATEGHEENMNCAGLGVVSQEAAAIIVGFLWSLHRDVPDVRERMARLEGTVDVLAKFLIDREQAPKP